MMSKEDNNRDSEYTIVLIDVKRKKLPFRDGRTMVTSHAVSIHRSRSAPLAVFSLILSVAQGNINSLSSGVLAAQHRELHLNEAVLWNEHTRMYELYPRTTYRELRIA